MFEIDFGPDAGGLRKYKNRAEVIDYAQEQTHAWGNDAAITEGQNHDGYLSNVLQAWADFIHHSHSAMPTTADSDFINTVFAHIPRYRLIAYDSVGGRIVRGLAADKEFYAASGAARLAMAGPEETIFQSVPQKKFLLGMLEMWAASNGLTPAGAKAARSTLKSTVAFLEKQVAAHREEIEAFRSGLDDDFNQFRVVLGQHEGNFVNFRASADDAINADRERWAKEWEAKLHHYTEELKIKAPVKLWEDRATDHTASFKVLRKWTMRVGIGGCVLIAVAAIVGGLLLFGTDGSRVADGHKLIYAGSISLIFLTMYLWSMRILVRMMMSDHHLSVDAKSRASMAHTYLALLEDGGSADEKDRAIVLASLFRPVTDGLVKDDALPLISPATILSGKLAG